MGQCISSLPQPNGWGFLLRQGHLASTHFPAISPHSRLIAHQPLDRNFV
jgi:hypothetical protein